MTALLERLFGPPMAAPETSGLRVMRITLLVLAFGLCALVVTLDSATRLFGRAVSGVAAGMVLVLAVLAPLYIRAKRRADDAHFERLIRRARR